MKLPHPSFVSHSALRSLVRSCSRRNSVLPGKAIHALILTTGLSASPPSSYLHNVLVRMYVACGGHVSALRLFDEIPDTHKDTVDWTMMISCLTDGGLLRQAIELFSTMQKKGVPSDDVTLVCLLSACASFGDVRVGQQGHGYVIRMGLGSSVRVHNSLMDMYVKSGMMGEARRVFNEMEEKSEVSWTVILGGAVKWEGMDSAEALFKDMPERNAVACTVMVTGYVENGFTSQAVKLLRDRWFVSNLGDASLVAISSAVASSGDMTIGRWVHLYVLKMMGMNIDVVIGTALLDMYAKCGRMSAALNVFRSMPRRNVVTWNAIISGLGMHGQGRTAVEMFRMMMLDEMKPDEFTLTSLLNACSHSGLVEEGRGYFQDLRMKFGIEPRMEHYACMVDLLGRSGRVEEAEALVRAMPMAPNEVVLGSLLGSCRAHGKLPLAEKIQRQLVNFDPGNTGYNVLISNMYTSEGKMEKADYLRQGLKTRGSRKIPGMSSIHINGQLHWFCSGDKSHDQTNEIYAALEVMMQKLRKAGYIPDVNSHALTGSDVMLSEEEIEQALSSHSEKLAICFGIMSTRPGTTLYVFKNLRICRDCHLAIKIVSRVYGREIVVRDRSRFHLFNHGSCSCSDYW
ncbi:hypothetical protein MLD38_034743 [Melastoma candidum]|uniref:Uncharacterized protein n=1 Tax=Melastoma candidum TaxID=119954 RepID=A0ACB9MD36_9MYRT|nr:hypothetical protein MLD38_034743 [Melastoma candidum]